MSGIFEKYAAGSGAGQDAAEQEALNRTLQDFPAAFINAFEYFSKCLCEEFEKQVMIMMEERN